MVPVFRLCVMFIWCVLFPADLAQATLDYRQGQDLSRLPVVNTGSGAHLASYAMGTGGPFPGGKAVGA
jgi:hypothetical protein